MEMSLIRSSTHSSTLPRVPRVSQAKADETTERLPVMGGAKGNGGHKKRKQKGNHRRREVANKE